MTPTVFPCYAAADRQIAQTLANFLERCGDARVFLRDGELRNGEDLAAKAREARTADIALVLYSRNSVPPRWPRSQWEDAFINEPAAEGTRIAFVRCDDYAPPRVLAPQFDSRVSSGIRGLKRWVRSRAAEWRILPEDAVDSGELEALGIALADRPGIETASDIALAHRFAHDFREDFDAVFRLDAGSRSLAALAGDLAAQLGLTLEGDLENNLERLRAFCSARRFLLLLEGAAADAAHELAFRGLCSTLFCAAALPAGPHGDSLPGAQRALAHPADYDWQEICRLARIGRRIARERGRIAELYEMMRQWHVAAEERFDVPVLDESAREIVWILEGWGRLDEARALEYRRAVECDEQMPLF